MNAKAKNGRVKPASPEMIDESAVELERFAVGLAIWRSDRYKFPPAFTGDHFLDPCAKGVFEAIRKLETKGQISNAITVKHELLSMQILDTDGLTGIGGEDMLVQLSDNALDSPAFPHLLEMIEEAHSRRRVREIARDLHLAAVSPMFGSGVASSVLLKAAADLSQCRRTPIRSIGEIDHEGDDQGVTTGFQKLDQLNSTGGYPAGQVTIVSAYHKAGKTAYKVSSALRQVKAGYRVLYATFADLNGEQLKRRALKILCGWSKPPTTFEKLEEYDGTLRWFNSQALDIYDAASMDSGYDVETFVAWLRAEQATRQYDCVFVDYAQKLSTSNRRIESQYDRINHCSDVISKAASFTGLPIVMGSQITEGREGEKTKTKGSRTLEEDAGWVLRLKRDEDGFYIESPYGRFGPENGKATLVWDKTRACVTDRDPPVATKSFREAVASYDPMKDTE